MATTSTLRETAKNIYVDTHDVARDVTDEIAKALNGTVRPAMLAVKTHAARAAKDPEAYAEFSDGCLAYVEARLIRELNKTVTDGRGVAFPVEAADLAWAHVDIALDVHTAATKTWHRSGTTVAERPVGLIVAFVAKTPAGVRVRKEHHVEWSRQFPLVDARP